jgi:hypothetical protein
MRHDSHVMRRRVGLSAAAPLLMLAILGAAVIVHLLLMYRRMHQSCYESCRGNHGLLLQNQLCDDTDDVTIQLALNRDQCVQQWCANIARARHSIAISMYHWQVRKHGKCINRHINPQIVQLGVAIRRCQQANAASAPPPTIEILFNKDAYVAMSTIRHTIAETLAVWHEIGVDRTNLVFYVWRQQCANNMHTKMVIVDEERLMTGSSNVQYTDNAQPFDRFQEWGGKWCMRV